MSSSDGLPPTAATAATAEPSDLAAAAIAAPSSSLLHQQQQQQQQGPRTARSVVSWTDQSHHLRRLAGDLAPGEVALLPGITLHRLVAALQLMDAKMDAGCVPLARGQAATLDDALDRNLLKTSGFTHAERIGLMDALLACEAAWLGGTQLPQSLFTCMYLHKTPSAITADPILMPVLTAILRTCEHIRMIVMRADVYHEEDIPLQTHGFTTCNEISNGKMAHMLQDVERHLLAELNGLPADSTAAKEVAALRARVGFRRSFFKALVAFDAIKCEQLDSARQLVKEAAQHLAVIRDTLALGEGIGPCEQHAGQSIHSFPNADATATPPRPGSTLPSNPFIVPFWLASQPLAASRIPTRPAACALFGTILDELLFSSRVTECTTLDHALDFVMLFNSRDPNVLSRSRLHATLIQMRNVVFGLHPLSEWIAASVTTFCNPLSLVPAASPSDFSANDVVKAQLKTALACCEKVVLHILRAVSLNRGRERRRIARMLSTLEELHADVEQCDFEIYHLWQSQYATPEQLAEIDVSAPKVDQIGTWVLNLKLMMCERFVLHGFRLNLFAPREQGTMLRYADYLFSCDVQMFDHVIQFHFRQLELNMKTAARRKSAKAKAKNVLAEWLEIVQLLRKVPQLVLKALQVAHSGLVHAGMLAPPHGIFDVEEVRYLRRVMPFFSLASPAPVTYEAYRASQSQDANFDQMLKTAVELLTFARPMLERLLPPPTALTPAQTALPANQRPGSLHGTWKHITCLPDMWMEELNALLKVIKMNLVVLGLVRAPTYNKSAQQAVLDFQLHPCYPIVRLVNRPSPPKDV
ncbi:hypothetical protein CAOG_006142 [Capsaspora owczarzaki ATCC 30864]|uniref:Uncharacterized protein n=1 Tax=Capsaspora owczarzaki (strain ATCC 30864) TaxID=595528 RepID=A0A0D2WTF0_CAPO3|nr:hypothetical protein CAOG_006142 [Capsaspora owczarzaki ATCC 30864]